MAGIGPNRFKNSANEIVEEKKRDGTWPVFDHYEMNGEPGARYIYAPRAKAAETLNESWESAPLSQSSMGLFLEFSNWPVEYGMDKAIETAPGLGPTFDTERNARAAREWAETFGVLGLGTNSNESWSIGGASSLEQVTSRYTGMYNWGCNVGRAYRKSPRGGEHETVEEFAFEAWQAHLARRLYELASRSVLDEEAITRLMDSQPSPLPRVGSEREMNSYDSWSIRNWALGIVEEAVMSRVENDCYPTVEGTPGTYVQGWGFKSLLGAMWLQMMWLMLGEHNRCRWCGALFEATRRDKRFCDNKGKCRAKWNYHHGKGSSNSGSRKKRRDEPK